ncbi:hypothetical protein [Bacillus alkalicellulosilyticus]|uniref:hypothetical protein n=1 Tax=Alkalihalobacterium alkalicellulosilyticum TaxID=1912214 RepID=UPI0014833BDC|nr:hypothetical protein [Bacillus alkalicellulosilyticus]
MNEIREIIEVAENLNQQITIRENNPLHDENHIKALTITIKLIVAELKKLENVTTLFDVTLSKGNLIRWMLLMDRIVRADDFSPFQHMVAHLKVLIEDI